MPAQQLAMTTLVVHDYDEAIAFFTDVLRFHLIEDTALGHEKRWVVVGPEAGAALLLARASNPEQEAHVGRQAGGRVAFFLETEDFWMDYQRLQTCGVRFEGTPRAEAYGTVVVFLDLYGNRWDLIGRGAKQI
jgi:catechol 2,3-dioxygenase-like lactoylglutathione lyase family enzyme